MGSPLQTRLRSTQDVLQARPTRCPLLLHLLLQQCQRGCHGSCWRHWSASVYAAQGEPCWCAKEAWHDQGRSLQHQRLHRRHPCCRCGQGVPRRHGWHHLQPCQLDCAHRRGGVQEGWCLQPQEDLWCFHPRRCPLQRVHWSSQGNQPPGGELPCCWRPRWRHHHATDLPVLPRRLLRRRHPQGLDRAHPRCRHRGGEGQGRRWFRHPLHGLCCRQVHRQPDQGNEGCGGRHRVRLRGERRHRGEILR